ncbi:MAG TPA: PAS domain S-box protein [Microvirga sp.]|jgi:PAS domain S-box-containing protein|nr:PAS domain S-box protein [Microvirga sp.]
MPFALAAEPRLPAHAGVAAGGRMQDLIAAADWSDSPLGPTADWPDRLTFLVEVVLASKAPMFLLWGPERILLYNDAYIPVLGRKHPWALGRGMFEVWSEARALIAPVVDRAFAGEPSYFEDLPVVLHRHGEPEQTCFTFSYTPVRGRSGEVAGALCALQETTGKVRAEQRLAFLIRLTDRLRGLTDPLDVSCEAARMLGEHLGASRVGYGDVDETERFFTTHRNWTDGTVAHHTGTHDLAAFGPDVHAALRQGEPLVVRDVATDPRTAEPAALAAFAALQVASAVTVSLIKGGRMVAALYVHSRVARAWTEAEIRLVQDAAERTWDAVERGRAEGALRASASRLRLAVDAGRMAVWEHDAATDTISTTPELNRLLGYPPDASIDVKEIRARYYPGDRDRLLAAATEAIRKGERFFEAEYRFYRRDGSLRWFLLRAEMDLGPDGTPRRSVGVLLDVTESRRNEEELQGREAELRAALDAGSLAIFDYDHVTGEIRPSPRLNAIYGYPPDHRTTIDDIRARYHPEDVEEIFGRVRRRNQDPSIRHFDWTTRLLLPDGRTRWVNGRGEYIRDASGRPVRSRGIVMDITERRQAEEANARLAAIVSSSPDAIVSFSAEDGRVLTWNRGAEALFGYTEAEAVGGPVSLIVSHDHLTAAEDRTGVYDLAMRTGQIGLDTVRRRKDGSLVPVSVSATRMTDAGGRVLGVSATFRDITERKRWEEHQRLLINELNHRVKNTLATVQSIASQTLRNAQNAGEARHALEDRLFALSRAHDVLTQENWEGASLADIVAQAMAPYRHEGERRLHAAGPDVRLPPGTALAVAMALHELSTNAVKYGALANERGEIRIAWEVEPETGGSRLRFTWTESGGPPVAPPSRRGFGTRLIERSLAQDLGGAVRLAFEPAGLVCTVNALVAPA